VNEKAAERAVVSCCRSGFFPAGLSSVAFGQTGRAKESQSCAAAASAAGISIFELARVMGASVKIIDKHYGRMARDSEQAIRSRLDARAEQARPTGD
jgi:hypothetical protein